MASSYSSDHFHHANLYDSTLQYGFRNLSLQDQNGNDLGNHPAERSYPALAQVPSTASIIPLAATYTPRGSYKPSCAPNLPERNRVPLQHPYNPSPSYAVPPAAPYPPESHYAPPRALRPYQQDGALQQYSGSNTTYEGPPAVPHPQGAFDHPLHSLDRHGNYSTVQIGDPFPTSSFYTSCKVFSQAQDPNIVLKAPYSNQYVYQPLPQKSSKVRILWLHPGEGNDPLRGDLIVDDLANVRPYEAISYTWTDKTLDCLIHIGNSALRTTRSTGIALKRVRLRERPIAIWIDAVCIDQSNRAEKGHQVGLMGSIYKQAKKVLIWLDGNSDHAEAAFELAEAYDAEFGALRRRDPDAFGLAEEEWLTSRMESPGAKGLAKVLSHQWFNRIWVLQEAGLAAHAEILCGPFKVSWDKFILAGRAMFHKNNQMSLPCVPFRINLWLMRRKTWRSTDPHLFIYILDAARSRSASNPRDKIFALLSHPSARYFSIWPNYVSTVKAAFLDVALAFIDHYTDLRILCCVQPKDSLGLPVQSSTPPNWENFPTWVPRWDYGYSNTCLGILAQALQIYSAGTGFRSQYSLSNGNVLSVGGFSVDVASFQSEALSCSQFFPRSLVELHQNVYPNPIRDLWYRFILHNTRERMNDFTIEWAWRAYCNTLTAGNFIWYCIGRRHRWVPRNDLQASLDTLYSHPPHTWNLIADQVLANRTPNFNPTIDIEQAVFFFQLQAAWVCHNRRFFMTQDGRFGLGPPVMRLGDKVCILSGLAVPLLLRPWDQHWKVVGECYVDGLMHGEADGMWRRGELQSQWFHII